MPRNHPPGPPPPSPTPKSGRETPKPVQNMGKCKFCGKKYEISRLEVHEECCYQNPSIMDFMKKRGIDDPKLRRHSEEEDTAYSQIFTKSEKIRAKVKFQIANPKSKGKGELNKSKSKDSLNVKRSWIRGKKDKTKIDQNPPPIPDKKGHPEGHQKRPSTASTASSQRKGSNVSYRLRPMTAPPPPPQRGSTDWRARHEETQRLIHYDKKARDGKIDTALLKDMANVPPNAPLIDRHGDIVICTYCGRRILRPRAMWHLMRCQDLYNLRERERDAKQGKGVKKGVMPAKSANPNSRRTSLTTAVGNGMVDIRVVEAGPTLVYTDYGQVVLPVTVRAPKVYELPANSTDGYKDNLVLCPMCNRKFFPVVAERHIPRCKGYNRLPAKH